MYVHPAFKIDDAEAIEHMRQRGFGLLVLSTPEAPAASHVPFIVESQADGRHRIALHLARANKLHSYIGSGCKALLVCQGPDAYISPDWYGVPNQVPTWTYTSVHVTGTARLLSGTENLAHVNRLSAEFEQRLLPKKPWTSTKMDDARRSTLLKAIVSIVIDVDTIEAQKKLIQHKGETEHCGAIAGLRARDDAGSQAIATMIEETVRTKFGN
jgi:transcriptional regulator